MNFLKNTKGGTLWVGRGSNPWEGGVRPSKSAPDWNAYVMKVSILLIMDHMNNLQLLQTDLRYDKVQFVFFIFRKLNAANFQPIRKQYFRENGKNLGWVKNWPPKQPIVLMKFTETFFLFV